METNPQELYTRSDVQRLFITGRSQAADLMRTAGATIQQGTEATVSRENLRFYVERCPEAAVYLAEEARKEKVARQLRAKTSALRFGEMIAGRAKPRDEFTRFEELTDISIQDGKLTIIFSGPEDLAYKLYKLSKAEERNPEEFWKMCDPPTPPPKIP